MTTIRQRLALSTGVELDVTHGGRVGAPAIIFLHGFPESARTWRYQLAEFAADFRVVAPDQRGYAGSSKPGGVADYDHHLLVADIVALADALAIDRFTLVGHDWGGAIAWAAARAYPNRVARLVIANAPHPYIFQKSLIDDPAQRAASQYIRRFRSEGIDAQIIADPGAFYDMVFGANTAASPGDKALYLDEWQQPGAITAMLNWYRASPLVVPAIGEEAARPAFLDAPYPVLGVPTLVIWGMQDRALLPCQLDGLAELVSDLRIAEIADAGHFVPWEAPRAVNAAIAAFVR